MTVNFPTSGKRAVSELGEAAIIEESHQETGLLGKNNPWMQHSKSTHARTHAHNTQQHQPQSRHSVRFSAASDLPCLSTDRPDHRLPRLHAHRREPFSPPGPIPSSKYSVTQTVGHISQRARASQPASQSGRQLRLL